MPLFEVEDLVLRPDERDLAGAYLPVQPVLDRVRLVGLAPGLEPEVAGGARRAAKLERDQVVELVVARDDVLLVGERVLEGLRPAHARAHGARVARDADRLLDRRLGDARARRAVDLRGRRPALERR